MPIDFDKIGREINILNAKAQTALKKYQAFMSGKAAGVDLTSGQKGKIRTSFVADITAARDAAQAVMDEASQ